MKFVDVTNDIAFRKIFGNQNKKVTLISFLNAVIVLPDGNKIEDVTITNPYQLPNLSDGKSTIVDVKAVDSKGTTFIVEMQVAEVDSFHKRVLYYTSQSYVSQLGKGKKYNKLSPAYFIGILEFEIGQNPNYMSKHQVLDIETKEHIIQDIEFTFIELPKFNKPINELNSLIDQWTFFIKNAENLDFVPDNINDEGLVTAYNEANKFNWTQLELDDYLRASIKEQDEIGRLEFVERRAQEKFLNIGINQGFYLVLDRGIEMGLPIEQLIVLTGLSKAEIENYIKSKQ